MDLCVAAATKNVKKKKKKEKSGINSTSAVYLILQHWKLMKCWTSKFAKSSHMKVTTMDLLLLKYLIQDNTFQIA